ncbi:unnamed protein product [Pedinophyceae sp. YPF-701]|nr:unnamed protein product [Pedinophyceae sp. YPF-701]
MDSIYSSTRGDEDVNADDFGGDARPVHDAKIAPSPRPASAALPKPARVHVAQRPQTAAPAGGVSARRAADRSRINVIVRARPMSERETAEEAFPCVEVEGSQTVLLSEFCAEGDVLRKQRVQCRPFSFDAVFGPQSGQLEVYQASCAALVDDVLQGHNACCFCYGATGAGKTHTMLGSEREPGVMVLALCDLYDKLAGPEFSAFQVKLSYLEVYNEAVRDLLTSSSKPLDVREDQRGVVVAGLTLVEARSAGDVMRMLHVGNRRRTTEATRCNAVSSRSHAVLQVNVSATDTQGREIAGKLSLIDLAGSERHIATEGRSQRTVEGANINRSLLALSSCISALADGKSHIPYRNSKLTKLLKDSLGGTCKTVMIANVSPSSSSIGETFNTLHWANRAKRITVKLGNGPRYIERPHSSADCARCAQNEDTIRQLRARLQEMTEAQELQDMGTSPHNQDDARELQRLLEESQMEVALMQEQMLALRTEVDIRDRAIAALQQRLRQGANGACAPATADEGVEHGRLQVPGTPASDLPSHPIDVSMNGDSMAKEHSVDGDEAVSGPPPVQMPTNAPPPGKSPLRRSRVVAARKSSRNKLAEGLIALETQLADLPTALSRQPSGTGWDLHPLQETSPHPSGAMTERGHRPPRPPSDAGPSTRARTRRSSQEPGPVAALPTTGSEKLRAFRSRKRSLVALAEMDSALLYAESPTDKRPTTPASRLRAATAGKRSTGNTPRGSAVPPRPYNTRLRGRAR